MAIEKRPHLFAYDISSPERLKLVAKIAQRTGIRLQYSFFILWLTPDGRNKLLRELELVIEPEDDDIRLYPLPMKPAIHHQGRSSLPDGVLLFGESSVETLAFPLTESEIL